MITSLSSLARSVRHGVPQARRALWAAMSSTAEPAAVPTFALPPLPYEYDALEPHIDSATMEVHHKRHHQTYISTLNGLVTGTASKELAGLSLPEIQSKCAGLPDAVRDPVVNSAGGH
jgi:superoxide dismutase